MKKLTLLSLFLVFAIGIFFLTFNQYISQTTNAETSKDEIVPENIVSEITSGLTDLSETEAGTETQTNEESSNESNATNDSDDEDVLNDESDDDDDDADQPDTNELTWIRSDSLRISKGPTLRHADGTSAVPFLYFGGFKYAAEGMKIKAAFAKDTHDSYAQGRVDSLTAPNSLVITVPRGGSIDNGPTGNGNHIYGNAYGDVHVLDGSMGSKGDFVTTDIYNLEVPSDKATKPSVAGPGILNKKYSMLDAPQFSYRIDPKTGFEQQRMIFFQQVKRNNDVYEVEVKIIQKFEKNGRVITEITYTNTGNKPLVRFMGFAFKDFSLTKDFREIRDSKGKKVGDYVPMRALGNGRGIYLQSGITESRYNLFTNLPNGPSSWAGRSISKAHDQQKGYINGFILGIGSGSRFPWYSGEGNVSHGNYESPDVPKGLKNSFNDMNDLGDAGLNLNAGARLGGVKETERAWDSGFAMHTKPLTLDVEKSVVMNYASQIDIVGAKFAPAIELDKKGTEPAPDIIQSDAQNYRLTGTWYDFDSTNAELYYTVDLDDTHHGKLLKKLKQSEQSANAGKPQEWSNSIPIGDLDEGLHFIRVWVQDSDGNLSEVAETVINITPPPNVIPTITILSPESSEKNPFSPTTHSLSLTGTWSDVDSPLMKSATYKVDDEEEILLYKNFKNAIPGSTYFWELPDLQMNKYNDLKLHKVTFTITDEEGNSSSDIFYFQHKDGSFQVVAPHAIDFGTEHIFGTNTKKIKPDISGTLQVHDFRSKNQSPLKITLSVEKFINEDDENSTLDHRLYWDKQQRADQELFIAKTPAASNEDWLTTTNLTDLIKKNIEMDFKDNESTVTGTYTSSWTWKAIESI